MINYQNNYEWLRKVRINLKETTDESNIMQLKIANWSN